MPGALEQLEPAAGHQLMRRQAVLDRDDRVAVAPDDHERDVLGEVEAVGGVHPLAQRVHDRPQRVHERRARLGVLERGVAAGQLGHVRAGVEPEPPEEAADVAAHVEQTCARQQRQHDLGERQRGGAQQKVQLAAQPAAVHEHQTLAALGELVGKLHHDPAAERVPHERRALVAEGHHQVANAARVGP